MDHIDPFWRCARRTNFSTSVRILFLKSRQSQKNGMSHRFARRLLKEHQAFERANLPGLQLLPGSDITKYLVSMSVANELYSGQKFMLLISIGTEYPVEPPLVKFVTENECTVPLHPHVYSNGHICLNVLGKDWTPACGVESVVLSVQSMLSTNTLAERPPDDARYVRHAPRDPKNGRFVYHDDTV
ncbi:ubiquitin-conjugating enzyme E2 W [Metschnikowia aff. pulcherrima]|uniref:Ubiquitin-conjugating enzyme E2 W n=2 Tax=Metschnikowia TaxID=27320 RepID=A0A4P6XTT2_9ASCO|nr:ubiquitin-conjugating enzyme E2 W [Metschnikowia aff. pulcherrima]